MLHYHLPAKAEIERLIENRLGSFRSKKMQLETSAKIAESLPGMSLHRNPVRKKTKPAESNFKAVIGEG